MPAMNPTWKFQLVSLTSPVVIAVAYSVTRWRRPPASPGRAAGTELDVRGTMTSSPSSGAVRRATARLTDDDATSAASATATAVVSSARLIPSFQPAAVTAHTVQMDITAVSATMAGVSEAPAMPGRRMAATVMARGPGGGGRYPPTA